MPLDLRVEPYGPSLRENWNNAVRASRNGTFLLERDYLDYHADRFVDASLVVWERQSPVALLPATDGGDSIVSHGGLTYGGLLMSDDLSAAGAMQALEMCVAHFTRAGKRRLVYKAIPHFYHRRPAEDDLYALFRLGAKLVRRDLSTSLKRGDSAPSRLTKGRKWGINRARKAGYVVKESRDFHAFMDLEAAVLRERHGTTPVHSGAEMTLLSQRFPRNIRLFTATGSAGLDAGAIVYDCGEVVHTQYLASSQTGRDACALDLVIDHLLTEAFATAPCFDFGISTERAGQYLNEGLAAYKESYGARSTIYDTYELGLVVSGATAQ